MIAIVESPSVVLTCSHIDHVCAACHLVQQNVASATAEVVNFPSVAIPLINNIIMQLMHVKSTKSCACCVHLREAEVLAKERGDRISEVIIADSSPFSIVENLQATARGRCACTQAHFDIPNLIGAPA
jgi:hypothetical protein